MSVIKYVAKSWHCSGCIQLSKMIKSSWEVKEVDIDSLSRSDLKDLNIRTVPVLVAVDDYGYEIERLSGVPLQDTLDEFLEKYC